MKYMPSSAKHEDWVRFHHTTQNVMKLKTYEFFISGIVLGILMHWLIGESRVWTQGFVLPKQVFYCLSHNSSPFHSGYLGDGVPRTICLGWLWTMTLSVSASQVARITGMHHQRPEMDFYLFVY
jgi:hypothetical protein